MALPFINFTSQIQNQMNNEMALNSIGIFYIYFYRILKIYESEN